MIQNISDIIETVAASGRTWRLSVAAPYEPSIIEAVVAARDKGFAEAIFFGDRARIQRVADKVGARLGSEITIIEAVDDKQAMRASVDAVKEGRADVLSKGLVGTSSLLRAVLKREEGGLRSGKLFSHVAVFAAPVYNRLMILTDAGVNITPNVHRKVQIVQNAIAVAKTLGMKKPRVAMLAAVDALNYPAMKATLDAALVSRIAASVMPDAFVDGPFALDNAVSPHAVETKGTKGEVAGRADILCAPEIETANVLYKALESFGGVTFAGVVVGIGTPIAVPSRADSPDTKLGCIALACLLSR